MFENIKSFISGKVNSAKAGIGEAIDNAKAKLAAVGNANTDELIEAEPIVPETEGETTIGDIAEGLKCEIADAKAVAESEAAAYSATAAALKAELSELDRTLEASRAELEKIQPFAALYKEGAVEAAEARLVTAETDLKKAHAQAADLEADGQKLEKTAKELEAISSKAVEVSNKAVEVSELTREIEKLVNKTSYEIKTVDMLILSAKNVKARYDRAASISRAAYTVASQKLPIVRTALAMAKSAVMAAQKAVNEAVADVQAAQATKAAKIKESVLNGEIAKKEILYRQKDDAKANAENAAYQATQDAKILEEAEKKAADVFAAAEDLTQKMDEYEKEVNEALLCDNREEAKALLVPFGFSAEEVEEILDANW